MKAIDKLLQSWRIEKVRRFILPGSRVLDIGCSNGELFHRYGPQIDEGVGIDPDLGKSRSTGHIHLLRGVFPDALLDGRLFDVITMLAVVEHIPSDQQDTLARNCSRLLKPGGVLAITVPSPLVDRILAFLKALRLIDGMSLEQHYGYDPSATVPTFAVDGLIPLEVGKFQFGLNNLFVFLKEA
jgi:2-polyprenyl-3-methyl-5-hydroxy-6-metoxy-1,4-benzoquinol methylase